MIKSDDLPRWQLMTYEQLQMIQDCCLGRHNVELALRFNFHGGTNQLAGHVRAIFAWQEQVLRVIQNKGYELVKAPEAIFKAWLNSLTGGDLLTYSSYQRTLDKMKEKEMKLHGNTHLVRALDEIVQSVDSIHDAAELFGLAKLSGHPVVYAEDSADSVRKEAEPVGTILPFAVRQHRRMFRHLTLSGYIREHSSWPTFICPPAHGTTLRRHYVNQVTTLPMGSYPMSDLDSIQFGKFVEYDYSEDYLKFLDDKAICPGASELSKFWFGGSGCEPRRLLQKILEMKEFNTIELVERIRKGGFYPDELVVELTQKERELKIAARCFCKLPFAIRTFFTSTEYNLKEQFMRKYMPQQTMTMSNTETKQRMYNLVKDAKARNRTLLEVDFSRWNLRWRGITVNPIARELEDIFGMPGVFSQAHDFFTRSTIVLTDKHVLPEGAKPDVPVTEWPTSRLVWRGTHLGGFEGIQQALWTICTIAMMYWVLHDQNLAFNMAGQGDNQIFTITFDESTVSNDMQLRKLLAVMEIRCKLLNHEVKPDECIDSSTVLTYSKDIYVEGNHILYNLKFASRTFKRDEIDIPSLSTEIASISACSMACADSVYLTPLAIFWKTFHTLRLLSARFRSPNYAKEHECLARLLSDAELMKFTILLPGSLGGLPCMAWTRFFMKGEVDDLSWDVVAVRKLAPGFPCIGRDLATLSEGTYTGKNPQTKQLILDPHSIPIDRPKDMKRLVKDAVAKQLPGLTSNVWIKEIISDRGIETGEQLMDSLSETRPFYPQIMSDLYSLSPSGVRDALISRFTMTRTITAITGNPNFSAEIEAANARLLRFIIMRYERARDKRGLPNLCSSAYDMCVKLRKLWGDHVDHKNVGVYNPFDFSIRFADQALPMISASSRSSEDNLSMCLGPYPPNFGTKTKQKVSDHGFKIVSSSSTLADLKRLVLTFTELGGKPELNSLISSITRARSPWSVSQLVTVLPTSFGGSAAHRHATINASAFSILGSRTVPTHLNFCSDMAGKLSGGEFDYPLAFQEYYLSLTNLFQVLTATGVLDVNASIGFLMSDSYEPLPTDPVTCKPTGQLTWPVLPSNKLCYIGVIQTADIPVVPSPHQIPHKDPTQVKPSALIYNRLLSKYCHRRRLFKSTASVNQPVDFIDMKEFAHCPLGELIRGASYFIQAMAIHSVVSEFTKDAATFLKESILQLCRSCSAVLTRSFLHPSYADTHYAITSGVICSPGQSGARNAADNLTGELFNEVLLSIKARDFVTNQVPLILFADYASYVTIAADIHATTIISLQSYDTNRILLTSFQRLMLRSARHTIIQQQRSLTIALNYASTVDTLARTYKSPDGSGMMLAVMKLVYMNYNAEEAIRGLRELPLDCRTKYQYNGLPDMTYGNADVRMEIENEHLDGSLVPTHVCPATTLEHRILDNFSSLLTRPVGVYSSALSVWLTVMQSGPQRLRKAKVMSVGVGHGAVAASALMYGATHVYGIDLRNSFPCISQREATYKPPEVLLSGLAPQFSWSKFVAATGGDALVNADKIHIAEVCDVWVVDIEQNHTRLPQLFKSLPAGITLWVRIICCNDWASFYYDALGADHMFNTSILRRGHDHSFVFFVKKFGVYNENANFRRRHILSTPVWKTSVKRHPTYTVLHFNGWLQKYGYHMTIMSMTELKRITTELTQRANNSNDRGIENMCRDGASILTEVTNAYLRADQLRDFDILGLSRDARRLLARWLGNIVIDTTHLMFT